MFCHRQSRLELKKMFENHTRRNEKTFNEYIHDKVIMDNRVPVDKGELLDYVISGILDEALRNQTRIQRFETMDDLQEALKKMTLGKESVLKAEKNEKWNHN